MWRTPATRAGQARATASFQDIFLKTRDGDVRRRGASPPRPGPEKTGTVTNSNRQVQMGRPALAPPGQAREDFAIPGRSRPAARPALDLRPSARGLRRDGAGDLPFARQHLLGAARARGTSSPIPARPRTTRASGGLRRRLPTRGRPCALRARRPARAGRDAGCGLPPRSHHRSPARALAHRRDDAPRRHPRRARARADGIAQPAHARGDGRRRRRDDPRRDPPRGDRAHRPRRRGAAGGHGLRALRLCRGGGEPPHQPGDRPGREDPRVQSIAPRG